VVNELFPQCPKISIDYAVMEKTDKACVFLSLNSEGVLILERVETGTTGMVTEAMTGIDEKHIQTCKGKIRE
jgi:hypothetical protein